LKEELHHTRLAGKRHWGNLERTGKHADLNLSQPRGLTSKIKSIRSQRRITDAPIVVIMLTRLLPVPIFALSRLDLSWSRITSLFRSAAAKNTLWLTCTNSLIFKLLLKEVLFSDVVVFPWLSMSVLEAVSMIQANEI